MKLLSFDIYQGKFENFLDLIKNPSKKTLVFTPNPEILLKASQDKAFLTLLSKGDYLVPDGNGLYTASLMLEGKSYIEALCITLFSRKKLAEKYGDLIKGSDLTEKLLDYAQVYSKKILIIDNYKITEPKNPFEIQKQSIQNNMSSIIAERFPALWVQVFFDGDMAPDGIAHHIELNKIDYVFTCNGMKHQEQLLVDIFSYLPENHPTLGLGVGSSFDYILGLQKRAPLLLQKLGLEWLYRFLRQPRLRWKRICDALVRFPQIIKNHTQ